MIQNPFTLLRPFEDRIRTVLFRKEDDPITDVGIQKALRADALIRTTQVHGNTTLIVREQTPEQLEADAIATDAPLLALTTRWADCQNFLVYAPKQNVVGLIHAGWKGLLAGVITEHFVTLQKEWNIEPSDTYVCAGPSLCGKCAEFSDPEKELPTIDPVFFNGRTVDLQGIADAQLHAIGVPKKQIERMKECTLCDSDSYWSYRGTDETDRNFLACCLI